MLLCFVLSISMSIYIYTKCYGTIRLVIDKSTNFYFFHLYIFFPPMLLYFVLIISISISIYTKCYIYTNIYTYALYIYEYMYEIYMYEMLWHDSFSNR